MQRQHVETQRRTHARELRDTHGGRLVADTVRVLTAHAASLRHEAGHQRNLCERKTGWMGRLVEGPSPAALRKADELDSRAGQIEQALDAIAAHERARLSPQAIERDIRSSLEALGFSLHTSSVQEGWRVEGWDTKLPTKQAA